MTLVELAETFDEISLMVETSTEDKRLVGPLLAVGQCYLVCFSVKLGYGCARLNFRPRVDHGGQSTRLHLQLLYVRLHNTKVSLGLDPAANRRNNCHLQMSSALILLEELCESATVGTT